MIKILIIRSMTCFQSDKFICPFVESVIESKLQDLGEIEITCKPVCLGSESSCFNAARRASVPGINKALSLPE